MILIFQRVLVNYRLPIFKRINKETGAILCVGKNGPKNTYLIKTEPDFDHIKIRDFYPIATREMLVIQDIFKPIFRYKPKIVIIEFALSIISNWFFLFLRPFFKFKIILWSHVYCGKRIFNPKNNLSDKFRIYWMNRADAVILYSYNSRKMIRSFVFEKKKIFIAPNTLDTEKLLKIRKNLEKIGKENVKKAIGLRKKYNLIYLGRLLKEKEPDKLLDIFKILSNKLKSIELHFIGNGPLYSKLLRKSSGLNIRFWGSISDDIFIGKLLFSSDLMVIPSYVGLSVVHSFCFDCPVVTQKEGKNKSFHGPEIEYLVDGKTGFIIENDNNIKMAYTILNYLLAPNSVKNKFRNSIRKIIETKCSIENMIKGFKEAINYCQEK